MTHHNINGKKVLVVPVPEDADSFDFAIGYLLCMNGNIRLKDILLPPGNYQLLGRAGELTEEQMLDLCPWLDWLDHVGSCDGEILHANERLAWNTLCKRENIQPGDLILVEIKG